VVSICRTVLADIRAQGVVPDTATCVARVVQALEQLCTPTLRTVLNGTGVLLQTNLGRAPLSVAARTAMQAAAGSASIEYDLVRGSRGERNRHLSPLLAHLTGAEGGIAVNNTAAAVLLILTALGAGREVIVSRGEAVEIGGGFRIPDVLRQSGATLVEVGTTNRTYVRDYADAITERTAMILCVHTSNFRQLGFVHKPDKRELADLAHQHGILLVDDIGSGSLIDVTTYGLTAEPRVPDTVAAGADLVCFSADKLLGGPQAGLIVGKNSVLQRLAKHPLMRALRLDKIAIAGIHATLLAYVMQHAEAEIPIWQMISAPLNSLEQRAQMLQHRLGAPWQVRSATSTIGGGALPTDTLPSWAIVLPCAHPDAVAAHARRLTPALIGRVQDDAFWIDMRSILPADDPHVLDSCRTLASPTDAVRSDAS
jgi:L-seryl-tRNA(Ser) seleniumtransferase